MEKSEFILSRHAKKVGPETPEEEMSEKYPGITKEGERETREKVGEMAEIVEKLPEGSVVVLSGVSRAIRTRSTLEIYGDELRSILKNRKDMLFVPKQKRQKKESLHEKLEEIKKLSKKIGDKRRKKIKAIVQFPLWIKQFTASPEQWQVWSEYFSGSKESEIAEWIEKKKGPNPDEVASGLLKGLKREEQFFKKLFPKNPITFINVDHSGELDALFTYLANEGKITKEGFEKIGGKEIEENEFAQLSFLPNGEIKFKYRDKTYFQA